MFDMPTIGGRMLTQATQDTREAHVDARIPSQPAPAAWAEAVPVAARRARFTAVAAGPALWRVSAADGRVVGHVAVVDAAGERPFRARRYHAASRSFRDLGDFWSCDQALECLRLSR